MRFLPNGLPGESEGRDGYGVRGVLRGVESKALGVTGREAEWYLRFLVGPSSGVESRERLRVMIKQIHRSSLYIDSHQR